MKGFVFVYDALLALIIVGVLLAVIPLLNPQQNETTALLESQPVVLDAATIQIHKQNPGFSQELQIGGGSGLIKSCEETIKYDSGNFSTKSVCRVIN